MKGTRLRGDTWGIPGIKEDRVLWRETIVAIGVVGAVTAWGDASTRRSDLSWLILLMALYFAAAWGVSFYRKLQSRSAGPRGEGSP